MAKKPLPLRIDEDLLRRVDEARGDVSRTRFVERALEKALAGESLGPGEDSHSSPRPASSRASVTTDDIARAAALEDGGEAARVEPKPAARKKAAKAPAGGLPSIAPRHWAP